MAASDPGWLAHEAHDDGGGFTLVRRMVDADAYVSMAMGCLRRLNSRRFVGHDPGTLYLGSVSTIAGGYPDWAWLVDVAMYFRLADREPVSPGCESADFVPLLAWGLIPLD